MGIPWLGGRWNRFGSTNVIVDYSRVASICGYVSIAYATSLPGKAAPFHSLPPARRGAWRCRAMRREAWSLPTSRRARTRRSRRVAQSAAQMCVNWRD